MKRSLRIIGALTAVLFGMTLAEAALETDWGMPRRAREEMASKKHQERAQKEKVLTPEEKMKRQEASERRRATFRKYVISPVKRLRPHRRPAEGKEAEMKQATTERQENINRKFGWLVPHRYPAGQSTDPGTNATPSTNVQPATYSTGETK